MHYIVSIYNVTQLAKVISAMTLPTVLMDVETDTGGLLVICNVLIIVKTVTAKLDNVRPVSLDFGITLVIHNARCIVLKEFVSKAIGTVKRDVHLVSMETRVIIHVVLGV